MGDRKKDNIYEKAVTAKNWIRKATGLIYDDPDPKYPATYTALFERLHYPSETCVYEGEAVLNAGHVVLCGKTLIEAKQNKLNIVALCFHSSAINADPHKINGVLVVEDRKVTIESMVCSCKAGNSGRCKHISAVLLKCNRNDLLKMEVISSTDVKCVWSTHKATSQEMYKHVAVPEMACLKDNISLKGLSEICHFKPQSRRFLHYITNVFGVYRCIEMGLIDRCIRLPTMANLTSDHLYLQLQLQCKDGCSEEMKDLDQSTFDCAVSAAGSMISLIEAVCKGAIQNGVTIIRPPGHHAMKTTYREYCFLNNVAIAAKNALQNNLAQKILIVDFDVHHGHAAQKMFYNDKRVLYFSIHRYEHSDFWPNLCENDYDYIGDHKGIGYNINCPLNETDLGNSDYFHIISHILLPVAYEFQPELIIFSAGYDACIGSPEGKMQVSPTFYGHLITLLSGLACGKLAVCLEGGYFLPSALAEGAVMTIKGLLGDSLPNLEPLMKPHPTVVETIGNLISTLSKYWKCFAKENVSSHIKTPINFMGIPPSPPSESIVGYSDIIEKHKRNNEKLSTVQSVSCCYDPDMLMHDTSRAGVFEIPQRLLEVYNLYQEWGLDARCTNLKTKHIELDVIHRVHKKAYIQEIVTQNFEELIGPNLDMFYNDFTLKSIMAAVGCLISVADSVATGKTKSGVALIRPPGHHAESDTSMGFCYCNNIAITAQYILDQYNYDRILIIDFDIHHGNGTQKIFYEENKVLYLSIHKYDNGHFFPTSTDGNYTNCGKGKGEGYNVNVPLTKEKHYDVDYISIFHRVVLPIAYSYAPDIILVSAGFDAGVKDYLGNYHITPECFAHFIQLLKSLGQGRIILGLEGGYNPETVKYSMNMCIKALLGDPLPMLNVTKRKVHTSCDRTVEKVIELHSKYWPGLFLPQPFLPKDLENNKT